MAHDKIAADKKTEDYFIAYFGEYGAQLVREIPRVIKAAVLPDLKRTASAAKRDIVVKDSAVVTLGYGRTDNDTLAIDGVIRVAFAEGGERKEARRMFRAEFSSSGDLLDIEQRPAPAV